MLRKARLHLINYRQLLCTMGWLLLIEACFMVLPALTCVYYGESDWLPFAATVLITAATGALMAYRIKPASMHMGKRDGYLLTALVWVVFSFFGLIPFLFGAHKLSYSDAFFEAMSGFTTTGASVIDATTIGHGIHLWRAMMQWIGGMGIILFTLAVIPTLNHSGGMQMFNAEVTGITHDKIRPRIRQTATSLWAIYLILTITLIVLLAAGPMSVFESVCHAFGTVSTGGYTTSPEGIAAWDSSIYTKIVITVFMFLGGVNFSLIFKTAHGDFKALKRNDVLHTYVGIILVALIFFIIAIVAGGHVDGWESVSIDPLFQVVSTITSTGFVVEGFEYWGAFVMGITLLMMFSGACAGSTSGGAKIDRLLYLFKNIKNELYRCLFPNSIMSVKVNDHVVNPDLVSKVIAFICIYMILIIVGGILLALCSVPLSDAFFTALSCLSNTGIGESYAAYPDAAKWILTGLMLTGRLEIFTVLVLFTPAFWHR